jgi:hypothetical protein
MPLQLGDVSHERGHIIRYDEHSRKEALEAELECDRLRERGFILKKLGEGEIILDPPPRDPNKGLFRILSENGDDHVTWDRREPAQVREAYVKFKEFIDKGYRAYATNADGKKGHRIDDFDPSLEEIILVPSTIPG